MPGGRRPQPVLDLVPQGGLPQRALGDLVEQRPVADADELQAGDDVVVDRHGRERRRLLEHHADAAPDRDRVDAGGVDVVAVEEARPVTLTPR
jgi:hypothetical protein